MKDKKAQGMLGWFFVVAIAIIVGVILITPIANIVAGSTNVNIVNNISKTVGTSDVAITGYQQVQGTYLITNGSTTALTSNVTLIAYVTNGQLQLYLHQVDAQYNGKVVNISGTLEPTGYAEDSASRSIIGLIVVFSAIGLLLVIIPNFKDYLDF